MNPRMGKTEGKEPKGLVTISINLEIWKLFQKVAKAKNMSASRLVQELVYKETVKFSKVPDQVKEFLLKNLIVP